jgi:F-type H+-transporting ATPase subunit alpha
VAEQIVVIWAGTTGQLDDVPVGDVKRFEAELLEWIKRNRSDTFTAIDSTGQLSDEQVETLQSGVNEFKVLFKQGETGGNVGNEAQAAPLADGSESRETVTREVRSTTDES